MGVEPMLVKSTVIERIPMKSGDEAISWNILQLLLILTPVKENR
jgi:hypothetical protein